MNREQWLREARNQSASWPAVVILYAILVGVMIGSALAIT